MRKTFLAVAFVLASAAIAAALSPAQNVTTALPPTICPHAAAGYADGCSAATVVPGIPQNPTLLLRYGVNRPPWNAAGVDYRVGYSGGLADPAGSSLPACASYGNVGGNNTVTVNSAPCTIDHFDFSLHTGVCLTVSSSVTSGPVTITNNNFIAGPGCENGVGQVYVAGTPTTVIIMHNTFDQSSATNFTGFIYFNNPSSITGTVEYNSFKDGIKDAIDITQSGTFTMKYNYLFALGRGSSHSEWFQLVNPPGSTIAVDSEFNTVSQIDINRFTSGGHAAWCYANIFNSVTVTSLTCSNEIYIGPAPADGHLNIGYNIRVEPGNITFHMKLQNNYMDGSGGAANIESRSTNGTATVTCTGNHDMTNGSIITTANLAVLGTPFVTCN